MTAEMTKEQDTSFLPSKNLTMPVIRRSRSLSELPGSIRIPILRRTDSDRMRARLEASMQGLDELKLLKEQQRKIIDDAMTSSLQRTGRSNTQQNLQRRMSVSSLRSSSTSLAKICEEVSENENGGSVIGNSNNNRGSCISNNSSWTSQRRHSFAQSQNSRSRRPLSLADSDLLEQELYNEDERLKKHHSWTSLMHSFYGSQPQALESTRSTECLRRSRSDDIPVHNPSGKLGRSQSFSVASDNSSLHFQFPREAKSYNSENIEPKLRRASIQCEAVLSGASVDSKQRGLFKDVDLNSLRGNFPNPLRAVLMQYGNSQPPREVQKRNTSDQREADSQSSAKVPNSKKSESNPVYDKYKQLNGTHCDNIQNSTGDRPKNNKNYDARNNTNKESRSTHNHRGSSETIGGSSRASLSNKDLSSKTLISENKDLSSKTLISDHRDRNMNNIGRRLSVPATITRCDAINNNTRLNPTASSDSINISETRPSLSLDNVSSITKTDGSRARLLLLQTMLSMSAAHPSPNIHGTTTTTTTSVPLQ
ncbi:LIM domain-containing protein A-like [Gigantopelta aegis]|uniref:LIM domain-containing protein A-like n=1 Tax=Gigantopelta aegis TaxID=1735272 RepID=UPI001B88A284|nr:LIM domain-containing protein A-like [Gigantopelta aegis]